MFKLLSELRDSEKRERREQLARYLAILETGDDALRANLAELQSLIKSLGKTTADVEADARTVAERKALRAQIESLPELEQAQAAARQAFKDYEAEYARELAKLEAKKQALGNATYQADYRWGETSKAHHKLAELEKNSFELFGLDRPIPAAPIAAGIHSAGLNRKAGSGTAPDGPRAA
jgi:chromosome segregation ATPase